MPGGWRGLDYRQFHGDGDAAVMFPAAALTLHLIFAPNPAYVPATAAVGTLVSTATPSWSNGMPFRGYLCVIGRNPAFRLSGRRVLVANATALQRDAGTT